MADLAALARSVICVGFPGARIADAPLEALRAFAPGGIILFARNVGPADDLRALITELRTLGEPAPLIAIDQEGGRVARIGEDIVAALPAAMAIAAGGDLGRCEQLGVLLGRDLARLGISVDLAPCGDLALDSRNTVIGSRSYGSAPHVVANYSGAFARGLERGGVAAAIKHFPGHGATHVDSHVALPRLDVDPATLRTRDLVPFASSVSSEAASLVMSAHIVIEALDPENPATMSRRILTGLLRGELGFDGAIVTDCLEMDAIAERTGTARGARLALAAGADLLLISHRLDRAEEAVAEIVGAVESGELPRERLESAARRVGALRARYAMLAPCAEALDSTLPLAAARAAVTVVRGDVRLRGDAAVTVISFEGAIADGAAGTRTQAPSLSAELRARRWKSEVMRVPLEPDADDLDLLLAHLPSLGDRNFVVMTRRAHLYPAQAHAVERILALVPNAIVLSAREPYDAALFRAARHLACIYGDERISLEGAADVLSGRAEAAGTLPVSIDRSSAVR
ncbi:MAG: glycoside hydrolase family 3 protein [Candidatus Velthaea sp.]